MEKEFILRLTEDGVEQLQILVEYAKKATRVTGHFKLHGFLYPSVETLIKSIKPIEDNPVASIDFNDIKCPRVEARITCEKCNYPSSEAIMDEIHKHIVLPCKHDLLKQNARTTDKEDLDE